MKLFGLIFAAATAAPISGSDYLLYQSLQRGDNSFNPFLFGLSTKEIIQIMVACLEISISQPQCCSPMATWLVWTWIISCLSIYWVETKLHPIKWLLFLLSMLHKLIKMSSQDIIRSKKLIKKRQTQNVHMKIRKNLSKDRFYVSSLFFLRFTRL